MMKFRLMRAAMDVWVDTDNPDLGVPIQFATTLEKNPFMQIVPRVLSEQTGAFGHTIGESTTPYDLHAAMMLSPELQRFKPVLIEGHEMVKDGYKLNIPPGAMP